MQNQRIEKILEGSGFEMDLDTEIYQNNCENIIGTVQIPVGVVGPIAFDQKKYIVPIATTEAVLVASINRGTKIIAAAHNMAVSVKRIGITRAPVYNVKKMKSEQFYKEWFKSNLEKLQAIISETSQYTKIIRISPKKYKGLLFVKFFFDTDDAMGMNMATIACDKMNPYIEKELKAECIALSSNFCSDKKISLVNKKEGRGFKVEASVTVKNDTIEEILKVPAKKVYEVYKAKIKKGSKLAKSIGENAQHANIIAGIFIATGQDPAHIPEASIGDTTIELKQDSIKFKVEIPCLNCGIIGGGTSLPSQQKYLKLLNVNSSQEMAKVIALAVLAGEISLLGSIAEKSLAKVHEEFRKKSN